MNILTNVVISSLDLNLMTCPLCPESMLHPLCHHSVTCKCDEVERDVGSHHNLLCNPIYEACQASCQFGTAHAGLGKDKANMHAVDTSVANTSGAAYNIIFTSLIY